MLLAGFKPAISAGELPYTYTLDRVATGTGTNTYNINKYIKLLANLFVKGIIQSVHVSQ
jgi:hypothetical protein